MNKITYIFLVSLIFLSITSISFASSYVPDNNMISINPLEISLNYDLIKDEINNNPDALALLGYVGEGKVNITDESTNLTIGVEVMSGKISLIQGSAFSEPNYIVKIKPSAKIAIMASSDPASEAKAQIKSGGITVEAQGIFESIKVFIFSIFSIFI